MEAYAEGILLQPCLHGVLQVGFIQAKTRLMECHHFGPKLLYGLLQCDDSSIRPTKHRAVPVSIVCLFATASVPLVLGSACSQPSQGFVFELPLCGSDINGMALLLYGLNNGPSTQGCKLLLG